MTANIYGMATLADNLGAFELRTPDAVRHRDGTANRLWLRATEDGWSLIAPDGAVVFHAVGLAGRRRCLRFARDLGVLAVRG